MAIYEHWQVIMDGHVATLLAMTEGHTNCGQKRAARCDWKSPTLLRS